MITKQSFEHYVVGLSYEGRAKIAFYRQHYPEFVKGPWDTALDTLRRVLRDEPDPPQDFMAEYAGWQDIRRGDLRVFDDQLGGECNADDLANTRAWVEKRLMVGGSVFALEVYNLTRYDWWVEVDANPNAPERVNPLIQSGSHLVALIRQLGYRVAVDAMSGCWTIYGLSWPTKEVENA